MDTPDRAAAAARAEDSPLFSFIDSLSPIEPLKSTYSASSIQAYQSLNITSISSIFTSPHDNAQKESKLSKSSFAEFSESEVCADESDKNKPSKSSNAVRLFACTSTLTQATHKITSSVSEGTVGPPEGSNDLPQPGQFDSGSPDHNTTPCHGVRSDLKQGKCRKLQAFQTAKTNTSEKRKCLFSTEVQLMDGCQPEKLNDEILGCDWDDLISATSGELIAYDEDHKGVQLAVSNSESCGFLLSKLTGDGDISDRTHPSSSTQTYYRELLMDEDQTENAQLVPDGEKNISTEEIQDNLYEANGSIPTGYKVETQQQRGMRRRCLVFEAAGYSNRIVQKESVMDLSVSTCKGKSPVQNHSNPGKTPSPRVLRGIGLHLNALALTSKDNMICQDPMSSLVLSSATQQEAHGKMLSAGENFIHPGGELLELQMDDDCSAGVFLGNDHDSSQSNSPQKKRRKSDNGDDGEACKRCSCKKSKCLKLYCECFAAGVYCSEPCSCQGCLNKPIHEEVVLSTRKQIEFRNPLAFAPKVIRMSDAGQDITGEDPNNTPASARHKRGCNCKKSSCLKKYCECYQGGVGCSSNCRCEGCKNTFGKRDAAVSTEAEEMKQGGEEAENCGKEKENDLQKANAQSEDHPFLELVPITPPFVVSSSLLKPPNFSSAKPPRPTKARSNSSRSSSKAPGAVHSQKFSKIANSGLNEEMPDILRDDASPGNCVKTSSPNGKRVSPPHNALSVSPSRKGGRKLILKSIPSFPSLIGDASSGSSMNSTESAFNTASPLALDVRLYTSLLT
uniref:CRC domain-containing protein n=1 Tax=Oryza barthii TaxID=65489 RepID=A0A0D3GMV8_9ORYZ